MSKSHDDPRSRILLTDQPEEINRKIKHALTDSRSDVSYDPVGRPGVSNLLDIWSHLDEYKRSPENLASDLGNASMRVFKERVAAAVIDGLAGIRQMYSELVENEGALTGIAERGAIEARKSADLTLGTIKDRIGL